MMSADSFPSIQPAARADARTRAPVQEPGDARNSDFANLLDAVVETPEGAIPAVQPAQAQPAASPIRVASTETISGKDAPPADPTVAAGIEPNPLLASLIVPTPPLTSVVAATVITAAPVPANGDAIGDLAPAAPQNLAPSEPAPRPAAAPELLSFGTPPTPQDAAAAPAAAARPAPGASSGDTPRATSAAPEAAAADAGALQPAAAQPTAPVVGQPVIQTDAQVATAAQAETVATSATPTLRKADALQPAAAQPTAPVVGQPVIQTDAQVATAAQAETVATIDTPALNKADALQSAAAQSASQAETVAAIDTPALNKADALQPAAAQPAAPVVAQPVIQTGAQVATASQAETVATGATPALGKSAPGSTPGSQRAAARAEAGDTEATAAGAQASGKAGAHAAASSQTVSAAQGGDGQGSNGQTGSGQTGQQSATADGLKLDAAATAAAQTTDTLAAARSPLSEGTRPGATGQAHPALRNAPETAIQVYTRFVERFDGRAQRFDMRLDPAELGRVDVRIEVGADKRVHAVLAAHDSGALSDLMRGQKALERALADAGIDLADGGLTFELSSESGGSASNGQAGSGEAGRDLAHAWRGFDTVSVPVDAETAAVATPRRWGASRLNLVA